MWNYARYHSIASMLVLIPFHYACILSELHSVLLPSETFKNDCIQVVNCILYHSGLPLHEHSMHEHAACARDMCAL